MWSPQQQVALDRVGRWIKERDKPFFQLAGYAGTGKTTLAKELAASVGGDVYFAAYTGKAAHVLMKSGVPNASTIHSLIYTPKDKSQQRLRDLEAERRRLMTHNPIPANLLAKVEAALKAERENLARPSFNLNLESPLVNAKLVVVDEYSMIDTQMGSDLLSFGCPVLALGDPGQLPPIRGAGFFSSRPDILLTEIHRQAKDNPIIWMSQEVREGRSLRPGTYGSSRVRDHREARSTLAGDVLAADQLLVGRNATRASSNRRVRELRELGGDLPVKGDKLVCLRNNNERGLLNGQLWKVTNDPTFDGDYVLLDVQDDDGNKVEDILAHPQHFRGEKVDVWARKDAEEFDFGYALTVHKAQGSQWSNLLLLDEWKAQDRDKWLYTAITRASESIDIIQM